MRYILICIMVLVGCTNETNDRIIISKKEYNKLKGIDSTYPKTFKLVEYPEQVYVVERGLIILGEDGHEYVLDRESIDFVIHYPECKLCLERYNNLMKRLETIEKNQANAK